MIIIHYKKSEIILLYEDIAFVIGLLRFDWLSTQATAWRQVGRVVEVIGCDWLKTLEVIVNWIIKDE